MLKEEHIVFIGLVRVGLIEKVSSMGIQGRGNSREKAPGSSLVSSWNRKEANVTAAVLARRRVV